MSELLQSGSVCTNCGTASTTSPTFIKANVYYLSQCQHCNQSIDSYIQYDWVIIALAFLLHKTPLYIHVCYQRLRHTPLIKLIIYMFIWLIITTFGFTLSASQVILMDIIKFPSLTPISTHIDTIHIGQSQFSDQLYSNLPHNTISHINNLFGLFTQGLPTITIPSYFTTFFMIDIIGLSLLTIAMPLITHFHFKQKPTQNSPKTTSPPASSSLRNQSTSETSSSSLPQSELTNTSQFESISLSTSFSIFIRMLIPALFGRISFLLSYSFSFQLYTTLQAVSAITTLTIAVCVYYHTIYSFYGKPTNLHKTDMFSVWTNFVPVSAVIFCYIIPVFVLLHYVYPNINVFGEINKLLHQVQML